MKKEIEIKEVQIVEGGRVVRKVGYKLADWKIFPLVGVYYKDGTLVSHKHQEMFAFDIMED